MEAHDDHLMRCNDSMTQIIKGKRTKRQRLPSPLRLGLAVTYSSASSIAGRTITDGYDSGGCDRATTSPLATSDELRRSTREEEYMANCLMLLAKGQQTQYHNREVSQTLTSAVISAAGIRNQGVAQDVYQCKTCNKCFSSFQALGGHRASYKKPKTMSTDQEKMQVAIINNTVNDRGNDLHNESTTSTDLSLQISQRPLRSSSYSNRHKVRECSLCGAVFSSGQALGGHMRRHRSSINNTATTGDGVGTSSPESQESRKAKNMLMLDLNLPCELFNLTVLSL